LRQFQQEETAMTEKLIDTKVKSAKKTRARVTEAVQEGTVQAQQAAADVLPAVGELAAKTLYGICYNAAFVVTFVALTIARLIPTESPAAHGLHDGTKAAAKLIEAHAQQQARMAAAGEGSGLVHLEGSSAT
jgi:hypothetical protein